MPDSVRLVGGEGSLISAVRVCLSVWVGNEVVEVG